MQFRFAEWLCLNTKQQSSRLIGIEVVVAVAHHGDDMASARQHQKGLWAGSVDTRIAATASCLYGAAAESPLMPVEVNRPLAGIIILDLGQVCRVPTQPC